MALVRKMDEVGVCLVIFVVLHPHFCLLVLHLLRRLLFPTMWSYAVLAGCFHSRRYLKDGCCNIHLCHLSMDIAKVMCQYIIRSMELWKTELCNLW